MKSADKPGSVVGNHSSGMRVTTHLKRPTREQRGPRHCSPIWSCSEWGFPCRRMLPPTRCALTAPFQPYRPPERDLGGIFSVALSIGFHLPGVTWHSVLWSPDFPPRIIQDYSARLPGQLPGGILHQCYSSVASYLSLVERLLTAINGRPWSFVVGLSSEKQQP